MWVLIAFMLFSLVICVVAFFRGASDDNCDEPLSVGQKPSHADGHQHAA